MVQRMVILAALFVLEMATTPASAGAQELRLYTIEVAPYSYHEDGVPKGIFYDVVAELAKRVGHSGAIQFLPLARARDYLRSQQNVASFPVAYAASRDRSYVWMVPIFQDEFVLFTRESSTVDISNIVAARRLRIGHYRNNLAGELLVENGFSHIEPSSSEEATATMLMDGRIDAWITAVNVANYTMRRIGEEPQKLRRGLVFARPTSFLAGSLDIKAEEVEKWRAAFSAMQRDGSYAQIRDKYVKVR